LIRSIVAFIALAIYVFVQSVWPLLAHAYPAPSPLGIVWLVMTCAVMLLLAWGKLVTGRQLGKLVLTTEARVTLIDAALAGAVLIGVGLNALFGWWWADPLAGLVIVYCGLTEGLAAWKTCLCIILEFAPVLEKWRGPFWVKLRNTQQEQMSSARPQRTDAV
jgi:divalent metal cation (Fe/Co/Zn/Cd) transporter